MLERLARRGNSYYMALSGTSQATAIASGVAGLTREFIREQVGVSLRRVRWSRQR